MKKSVTSIILISFLALISITFFLNQSNNTAEAQNSKTEQIEESNKIMNDINKSKLQDQITEKLKQEGYTPTGTFGYSIYNFEDKSITIDLSEVPKEKTATKKHIQKIVNKISQENQLGFFKVTIQ